MGYTYFNNKNWADITREERYFCLELFNAIKGNEKKFVEWLQTKETWNEKITYIDESKLKHEYFFNKECLKDADKLEWEVGFEVCFYRDLIYYLKKKKKIEEFNRIKEKQFSLKRTFDLCLFSKNHIIIIEAKAYEGFTERQMKVYKKDFDMIKELLGNDCPENIGLIGLCRSTYNPHNTTLANFHAVITWEELFIKYNNPIFDKADRLKT